MASHTVSIDIVCNHPTLSCYGKCEAAPGCGEWVRPMKSNPEYKGKWSAPLIDNPAYKGVWKPRQIGECCLPLRQAGGVQCDRSMPSLLTVLAPTCQRQRTLTSSRMTTLTTSRRSAPWLWRSGRPTREFNSTTSWWPTVRSRLSNTRPVHGRVRKECELNLSCDTNSQGIMRVVCVSSPLVYCREIRC